MGIGSTPSLKREKQVNTEQRLKNILQQVNAGIASVDKKGHFIEANERYCDIVGRSEAELLQLKMQEITHPEDLIENIPLFKKCVNEGKSFVIEKRYIKPDGNIVWVNNSVALVNGTDGEEDFITVISIDITTQKASEQAMRENEKAFKDLADAMPQMVWAAKPNGETYYFNKKWQEYTGTSVDNRVAEWNVIVHPDDVPASKQAWQDAIATGKPYEVEYRMKHRDGHDYRWFLTRALPVKNEQGEVIRWYGTATDVHDQKIKDETILMNSMVLDSMDEGVSISDENGTILYTNPAEDEMFGYAKGELTGKNVLVQNAYSEEENKAIVSNVIEQLKIKGSWQGEWHNKKADGTAFFTHSYITTIEVSGQIRFICVQRDITEEKKTREAILSSEKRYKSIFESAAVAIWEEDFSSVKEKIDELIAQGITDIKQYFEQHPERLPEMIAAIKVKDVNMESVKMFGARDKEELINGLGRIMLPETFKTFGKEFEVIGKGEPKFKGETVLQTLDGKKMDVLFTMAFPSKEDYSSVLVSILDITQQKQFESLLKEREERFRNLANNAPMFVWMTDEQAQVKYANNELLKYVGIEKAEDFMANTWEQMTHPDDIAHVYEIYSESLANPKPFDIEVRFKEAASGEYNYFLFKAVPIFEREVFTGFIGTAINIHKQKLFTEELERLVEERTHSLQEANKKLENSNQELERFAYVASHDLQEPLRKVKAFGDMLKTRYRGNLGEDGADLIDRMQSASYRMKNLIEDLLAYSRVTALMKPHEQINLNQVIGEVLNDMETTIKEKNATVELPKLPNIMGDELQLRQLFQNLLSNAIKFAKPDVPSLVRIECDVVKGKESGFDVRFKDGERKFLYLSISDNGIGFEPLYVDKIFQIFQRLHGRSEYEGSGIGLSIVKKVMENHNGYIKAEGQSNVGATFKMLFPM
jgi:PAS domain S-box-containing protein